MCDNGYSGNDCNQLCSGSPGYCDNNTTYCTRNGTCLCKDGLIPQNGNYPTCNCPNSTIQYGSSCTDCSQCSSKILRSICDCGYYGSGQCYCPSNYVMNINKTACVCPSGKYGLTCAGNCPLFSICSDGINGTGQCICQNNFYFNTTTQTCECQPGYYGLNCSNNCPNCNNILINSHCNDAKNGNGQCICNSPNFTYSSITKQCECSQLNAYGPYCNQTITKPCSDINAISSLGRTGYGKCYCKPLFIFNNQTQNCQCINSNTYGINCTQQCPSF